MKAILTALGALLFITHTSRAQSTFGDVVATGKPYSVVVQEARLNGSFLHSGDEIALFDGEQIVGKRTLGESSFPLSITAWEASADNDLPGFDSGNAISVKFRVTRFDSTFIVDAALTFSSGNGNFGFGAFSALKASASSTVQPKISLSPTSFNFGKVRIGESLSTNVTVKNEGNTPLQVYGISASNGQFKVESQSFTLQANATRTVAVSLEPFQALPIQGSLTVNSNDPANGNAKMTLSGQGLPAIASAIYVETSYINFGNSRVGETKEEGLVIRNSGTDVLNISSIAMNSTQFEIGTYPNTMQPGESHVLKVLFKPQSVGSKTSQINIQSDATNSTFVSVSISGNGYEGFYENAVVTGKSYTVIIKDIKVDLKAADYGAEVALFDGETVVGLGLISESWPLVIQAWQADAQYNLPGFTTGNDISVRVYTDVFGTKTDVDLGILNFEVGNGKYGSGIFSVLTANGESGMEPKISMISDPLVFKNITLGATDTLSRTITNEGASALSVQFDQSSWGAFRLLGDAQISVPANSSVDVKFVFQPDRIGLLRQNVRLSTNDLYRPNSSIALVGRSIITIPEAAVDLSFSSDKWIDVKKDSSANVEFTLKNEFTGALDITLESSSTSARVTPTLSATQARLNGRQTQSFSVSLAGLENGLDTVMVSVTLPDNSVLKKQFPVLVYTPHFGEVKPTGKPWTLIISQLGYDGRGFEIGDEVAFFDGEKLAGVYRFNGKTTNVAVTLWEGDSDNGLEGFSSGNAISTKFWKHSRRYESRRELVPIRATFDGAGTFGTGSFERVSLKADEPPYFSWPKDTIVYASNAFTAVTWARQDTLAYDPNGQTLTRTFSTNSEEFTVSVISNLVRFGMPADFAGTVELYSSVTDGTYNLTDTTQIIVAFAPTVQHAPDTLVLYKGEQRNVVLNGDGGVFFHPKSSEVTYKLSLADENQSHISYSLEADTLTFVAQTEGLVSGMLTVTEINNLSISTDVVVKVISAQSEWTWFGNVSVTEGEESSGEMVFGVGEKASLGLDPFYDLLSQQAYSFSLGEDKLSQDIRFSHNLADTSVVWEIRKTEGSFENAAVKISLNSDIAFPVFLTNRERSFFTKWDKNATADLLVSGTDHILLAVGDTLGPVIMADEKLMLHQQFQVGDTLDVVHQFYDRNSVVDRRFYVRSGDARVQEMGVNSDGAARWIPQTQENMPFASLEVVATDFAGNESSIILPFEYGIFTKAQQDSLFPGWNMVAIPFKESTGRWNSWKDAHSGLLAAFDFHPKSGYAPLVDFAETRGTWVASLDTVVLAAAPTIVRGETISSLSAGWNLVGNPFLRTISVDSLLFTYKNETKSGAEAKTAGWISLVYQLSEEGYEASAELRPWHGYWLGALKDSMDVSFRLHKEAVQNAQEKIPSDGWQVHFHLITEKMRSQVTIGQSSVTTNGFDVEYDKNAPPPPPSAAPILAIKNPAIAGPLGDSFLADFRSFKSNGGSDEWEIYAQPENGVGKLYYSSSALPDSVVFEYLNSENIWTELLPASVANDTLYISAATTQKVRARTSVLTSAEEIQPSYSYLLNQNYPNPFNPSTNIVFEIAQSGRVQLEVINLLGQRVALLVDRTMNAGRHTIRFDASNLANGIYMYRLSAGNMQFTKKMMLVK